MELDLEILVSELLVISIWGDPSLHAVYIMLVL